MAHLPRLDLPGIPQHIVQRGNNRLPCFLDDQDRGCYLALLREALLDAECALHAYVLMNNHTHLLVTPPSTGVNLSPFSTQRHADSVIGFFKVRTKRRQLIRSVSLLGVVAH